MEIGCVPCCRFGIGTLFARLVQKGPWIHSLTLLLTQEGAKTSRIMPRAVMLTSSALSQIQQGAGRLLLKRDRRKAQTGWWKTLSWMGERWWEGRGTWIQSLLLSLPLFICLYLSNYFHPALILSLSHLLTVCLLQCFSFSPLYHTVWLVLDLFNFSSSCFFSSCGWACVWARSVRLLRFADYLQRGCTSSWFLPSEKTCHTFRVSTETVLCCYGWVGLEGT